MQSTVPGDALAERQLSGPFAEPVLVVVDNASSEAQVRLLLPSIPFPAAIEDVLATWRWPSQTRD